MGITRDEALEAVQQLERTEARATDAYAYRVAGGQLILWGLIWALGYSLSGMWPQKVGVVWLALVPLGFATGFMLARRSSGKPGSSRYARSWLILGLTITAFIYAVYYVFPITSVAQALVFPPLLVAFVYTLVGSARLTRLLWVGVALFVLAMAGFVFLKPILAFWLAAVGGGALVAGGLWLRDA